MLGLLANDHLLKGAGVLPGWVTGKLSDLAGYFLFPSLLAVLLRVRTRGGLLACHLASVALLLLTELSPAVCRLILAVSGHRLWPDPTDLVALVSIGLSWHILARLALRPEPARQVSERRNKMLVFIGAVACVATSPRRPVGPVGWYGPAEVYVQNDRVQPVQVRVSAPREKVLFDCASALASPELLFSESQFTVVDHVTLGSGDAMPLQDFGPTSASRSACPIFLLAIEGAPTRLVVWQRGTLRSGISPSEAEGGIHIRDSGLDAPTGLLRPAPSEPTTAPSPACAASDPGSEPTWSLQAPSGGPYSLRALSIGSDGCNVLTLMIGSNESRFTVCSDAVAIPFVVGDQLSFRGTADGSDGLVIEGQSGGKTQTLTLVRRANEVAPIPLAPACGPSRRTCGAGESVAISVPTALGPTRPLARGEQQTLMSGSTQVRVTLLRAEQVRLADQDCDAQETLGPIASYITLSTR